MACLAFGIYVEFCCLVNFDNRNTPNNSGVQIIGGTSPKQGFLFTGKNFSPIQVIQFYAVKNPSRASSVRKSPKVFMVQASRRRAAAWGRPLTYQPICLRISCMAMRSPL